jgi:hypothetical protein
MDRYKIYTKSKGCTFFGITYLIFISATGKIRNVGCTILSSRVRKALDEVTFEQSPKEVRRGIPQVTEGRHCISGLGQAQTGVFRKQQGATWLKVRR